MRNAKRSITLLLTLALLAAAGCSSEVRGTGAIGKKPTPIKLEVQDKAWLLSSARTLLRDGSAAALPDAPPNVASLCGREVWVSAFPAGAPDYAVGLGLGDCVVEGLRRAAKAARDQKAFGQYLEGRLDQARVKVDILDESRKVDAKKLGDDRKRFDKKLGRLWEPGWWGASATIGGTRHYILPDTVVFRGWALNPKHRDSDERGRRSAGDVAARQIEELARMAGVEEETIRQAELSRFTTVSFIEERPGQGVLDLVRGNVLFPRAFTRQEMLDLCVRAGDQLLRHQQDDGSYGYWYMTDADQFSKTYGVPRHAGTVWGLFRLYKEVGEKRFLESAKKGLGWLEARVVHPEGHPDLAIIPEKTGGRAQLGTMALTALAIIEMPKEEMSPERLALERELGAALLFMIHDDGRVYRDFSQAEAKRLPEKQPIYYPGEAALALIHLHRKHGDPKWLEAARRICDYQIEDFRKTGVPDNWIIQDLSWLYRLTKDPKYLEYGYRMADYNVKAQWKPEQVEGPNEAPYYDYLGGFNNSTPPRSTPAGSRTEAMDEAYALAKFAGDAAAMKKYGDAIWRSMWFMRNHQYRPENTFYLRNPAAAMGGLKGGLIDNNIRIDYNQHIIMAVLNGLVVFDDRPGISTETVF